MIDSKVENAEEIEMPDIYTEIHAIMEDDESGDGWEIYEGDKSFDSNILTLDKNIYVNGNIYFNATGFNSYGIVSARNSITYNVGSVTTDEDSQILIDSEEGNITINGGNINLNAVLYAPNGKVTINANEFHLNGRIIADEVSINGTLIDINAGNHDYDMISGLEIFNTEIIKIYDTKEDFSDYDKSVNAAAKDNAPYNVNYETNGGLIIDTKSDISVEELDEEFSFDGKTVREVFNAAPVTEDGNESFSGVLSLSLDATNDKTEHMTADITQDKAHYYMLSSDKLTWKDAEQVCKDMGGYLAVMDNASENEFVKNFINQHGTSTYTAIGYTDEVNEGRWQWVNGSDSNYTNWRAGEPNDGMGLYEHQNYAFMYTAGDWDDGVGGENEKSYYVCEWDSTSDAAFGSIDAVVVKLTVDSGVDISDDFLSLDDVTMYETEDGRKIIIWKTGYNKEDSISIPVGFDKTISSDKLISDINVYYNMGTSIKTKKLSDITVEKESCYD